MSKPLKIIVVGTKPSSGRGGISTALEGYIEGLDIENQDYSYVNSHIDSSSKVTMLKTWFSALIQVFCLVREARKKHQSPVVWLHCAAWLSLFRKSTIALIARLAGAKVIIHIHSHSNLQYLANPIKRLLFRVVLSPAHMLFVLTPWWRNHLAKYFLSHLINIVPNPVGNQLLNVTKTSGKLNQSQSIPDEINIVAMSRLVSGKGFEDVITGVSQLGSNYRLLIAGDGPLLNQLKSQVDQLGLNKRVDFLGWLNAEEKVSLLCQSDVFCLPSKNDSFGMVYIEAMACGIPVVALNYGAIPDVVTHDISGVLCETNTSASIAEGIEKAIKNREQLVKGGIDNINLNYTPQIVAKTVVKAMLDI